jgi:hypothetical protein
VTPEEIEAMLDALVVKNTADGYEYGEHLPVSEFQLARDVAEAVAKRCAEICDTMRAGTLAAQAGNADDLSNVMLRQVAHLGHEQCRDAIRAEFLPATGQGGG